MTQMQNHVKKQNKWIVHKDKSRKKTNNNVCTTAFFSQRMVHRSRKSPPALDVQPAHQTLEPVMSSHFKNRYLTHSPAHSSLSLLSLTY